jgi:hypothetical protein
LPALEDDLNAPSLIAEERSFRLEAFTGSLLESSSASQLRDQRIGQKQISCSAALRDLAPQPNPRFGCSVREEHIPSVESHYLGKPEASAEGEGENQVIAGVACGDTKRAPCSARVR